VDITHKQLGTNNAAEKVPDEKMKNLCCWI